MDRDWWWEKEDAPCCAVRVDALGRLPLGYCSPACVRRTWVPVVGAAVDVPLVTAAPTPPAKRNLTLLAGGR